MPEISSAETIPLPAEAEETAGTPAEPDGGVDIVIREEGDEPPDVAINFGGEIRIVAGPTDEEPIL
jgi:hypothetical protein